MSSVDGVCINCRRLLAEEQLVEIGKIVQTMQGSVAVGGSYSYAEGRVFVCKDPASCAIIVAAGRAASQPRG